MITYANHLQAVASYLTKWYRSYHLTLTSVSEHNSFDTTPETCDVKFFDLLCIFVYSNYVQLWVISQSGILSSLCLQST